MEFEDCGSTELEHYIPIWLQNPRDYQDHRSVEAEAFNQLLSQHLDILVETWQCDESGWKFCFDFGRVDVLHGESTPLETRATSDVMPRKYLDGMRGGLRALLTGIEELISSSNELAVLLLQLTEEVVAWRRDWKIGTQIAVRNACNDPAISLESHQGIASIPEERRRALRTRCGFQAGTRNYLDVLDNPFGVDLRSLRDTAAHILGDSIENICAGVPSAYRILHVEPVFRNDLYSAFTHRREQLLDELRGMPYASLRKCVSIKKISQRAREDNIEGLAQHLAEPMVTFHGAPRHVIGSIVRYGFVLPGQQIGTTGVNLGVRCGNTYGVGIYSSPDAEYASAYVDYAQGEIKLSRPSDVPGMRLLVCATLMGRPLQVTRDQARRKAAPLAHGAHSHVDPQGMEYIVFDAAQIIPCYVLHLDYGADMAKAEYVRLAEDPRQHFRTGRKKRLQETFWQEEWHAQSKKAAMKAAATKYFPYGFGPAKGLSFIIEDMADVSDDEELFGEFREFREEQQMAKGDELWEERLQYGGGSWFDEYQLVRKSNKEDVTT